MQLSALSKKNYQKKMNKMTKILNPPIKLTAEIIIYVYECTKRKKVCNEKEIRLFVNKTDSYITKSLDFLKEKEIIISKNEGFILKKELMQKLSGQISGAEQIIKSFLIKDKKFIEYSYFISVGQNPDKSAKILKSIYNLDQNEKIIIKIFNEWITYLKIDIKQKISKNETVYALEKSIDNKLLANKFLREEFGELFSKISEDVLDDLATAITKLNKKNEEAINDAGRALEDFLRIDLANNINLKKCSGIVQISNELNKYEEFPTKLNNISSALGNIRSMGKAHGVDAKLKERWTIKTDSTMAYILLILSIIKSYLNYKEHKYTVF